MLCVLFGSCFIFIFIVLSSIFTSVNGVLAVTRAFGDTQFKTPSHSAMATGSSIFDSHPPLVIAEPEVKTELVTPKTEFAILATDGLWDVMSPQVAVTFVRSKLLFHKDLQKATKELVKEAISRGSIDNVTAIVVTFNIGFAETNDK
jgi:serine/threonine protein phosphatase PrpC